MVQKFQKKKILPKNSDKGKVAIAHFLYNYQTGKALYDADNKPNTEKTLNELSKSIFKLRTLRTLEGKLDEAKNKGVVIYLKQYDITKNYLILIDYWNGYNDHRDEDL